MTDLTSGDEARAEAAASELPAFGEAALSYLQAMLRSPAPDQRWWAVRVLAQMPQAEIGWLWEALADPAAEVRQCAALALCSRPDDRSVWLLTNALADRDAMVSSLAANALIALGEAAVPALLEVLQIGPQSARIQAMRALAEIADPRSVPAMMAAFEQDSALLEHWAEVGLERLGLNTMYFKPD